MDNKREITLTSSMWYETRQEAKRQDKPIDSVIRLALEQYLASQKEQRKLSKQDEF